MSKVHILKKPHPPYHASAVHFDGTQSMSRSPLIGVVDSPYGTLSVWTNFTSSINTTFFDNDNEDMTLGINFSPTSFMGGPGTQLNIALYDLSNANRFRFVSPLTIFSATGWNHHLFSWNMNFAPPNRIFQYCLNGVFQTINDTVETGPGVGTSVFAIDYASGGFNIEAFQANNMVGDIADPYFNPGLFLDLSDSSNISKFISGGKPVDPTTFPSSAVLFSGNASTFPVNQGSGGPFTLTGTLTDASTSPSD